MLSPPSRGAWIEINVSINQIHQLTSPPTRGAWFLITNLSGVELLLNVAPLAGGVD